ncbi:hypothetical protein [uncultured Prevotella sp.]|jgi:hypothetical protein|uniref:hypothetical protein n=1 Tax=uncultured Prevotella sp. TaxID=159272 RepID=UPI0027E31A6A|nr:hypothetical protein [uncultured Prevotella sp.]
MGKIGFVPTLERDDEEKQDVRNDEPEDGLFFKRLISDNFAVTGERKRLILRSSREIAYMLRNTYPVTTEEVAKLMKTMSFKMELVDGEPLWRLYELQDLEV